MTRPRPARVLAIVIALAVAPEARGNPAEPGYFFSPQELYIGPLIFPMEAPTNVSLLNLKPIGSTLPVTYSFHDVSPGGRFHFRTDWPCIGGAGGTCDGPPLAMESTNQVTVVCVPMSEGFHIAELRATTSFGAGTVYASLSLTCEVTDSGGGMLVVTPSYWDYGDVAVDTTSSHAFDVHNTTGSTLSVFTFTAPPGFEMGQPCPGMPTCTQTVAVMNGDYFPPPVEVRCAPTFPPTFYSGMFTIDSGAFTAQALVDCNGVAQGSGPEIFVGPSPLHATAPVGEPAYRTFTIENQGPIGAGDLAANIEVVGVHAGQWQLSDCIYPTDCTIPQGGYHDVSVTFAPDAIGDRSATLRVRSNDADELSFDVTAVGIGEGGLLAVTMPSSHALDFGMVPTGISIDRQIQVRNDGNIDLTVSATASSIFTVSPPAHVVPPGGGTQTFIATCAPIDVGVENSTIPITAPAVNTTQIDVAVRCEGVASRILIDPAPYDFGRVRVGDARSQMITVSNVDGVNAYELGAPVVTGDPSLTLVDPPGPMTLAAGQSIQLTARFAPTAEGARMARVEGLIVAEPTRTIDLGGEGAVADYTVDPPSTLDLGTVCIGDLVAGDITLTATGTADLTVMVPELTGDPAFSILNIVPSSLPTTLAPDSAATIELRATAPVGVAAGHVTWPTDRAAGDSVEIDVAVTGIASGLAATPGSHDFGPVSGHTAVDRAIRVQLCGLEPTTVRASLTGDGSFDLIGTPDAPVSSTASMPWLVRFTPDRAGIHRATLRLTPADGVAPPMDIAFTGSNFDIDTTNYYACGCNAETGGGGAFALAIALVLGTPRRRPRS